MEQKYIVKNKRTGESLELTLNEFKIKFHKEISAAYDSYKRHKEYKRSLLPPFIYKTPDYKSDFYSDLRWNFNNHGISAWYIERIV